MTEVMTKNPVNVFSEIGRLKTIMLHRPGKELENLMPDYLERLLFDDIPFLKDAQEEHDHFADVLRENGVEVLYLERLAQEAIDEAGVKEEFIDEWIEESGVSSKAIKKVLKEQLMTMKMLYLFLMNKS